MSEYETCCVFPTKIRNCPRRSPILSKRTTLSDESENARVLKRGKVFLQAELIGGETRALSRDGLNFGDRSEIFFFRGG